MRTVRFVTLTTFCLLASLAAVAGNASARTLHDGVHGQGRAGQQWQASSADRRDFSLFPLSGKIVPESGAIEFVVTRGQGGDADETLFSFLDNNLNPLYYGRLVWNGRNTDLSTDSSVLVFGSFVENAETWQVERRDRRRYALPVVALPQLALPRAVAVGETVRIALTWSNSPESCAVFADGVRLPARVSPKFALPRIIRMASYISVGGWPGNGFVRPYGGFGSALGGFRILDRPDLAAPEGPAPVISGFSDDTFKVPGISGKLVAGDTVTVEMRAQPGGKATFDMGRALGVAMTEVPPREGAPGIPAVDNGTYRGTYTIRPGDDYEDGFVVGHFVSSDNVAADNVTSASKWTIDTKPRVTFAIDKKDMPADQATKARIKLVARDANGNPVKGRHLKLTLATTDEYTGTVGAGDFGKEVGASVETRWRGETDSWGEVEFDYTAGFAAKTVILSAKDLDSGGVSVDYLTAYKEASIDISLTAPVSRAAARRGGLYTVKVEASRTELTADGRSRSTIRAKVLDPSGSAVAGDPVTFTLSSENGSIRVVKGTTDATGTAIADYIAGKKIGIVVVTAVASNRGASGSVSILLLSDAPAKIRLAARPATLPADGFSRSDLEVKVTDINDNPNRDTLVEFKVARGGGRLEFPERVTDRDGDAGNRYTAGTTPGIATIAATVRSKVPTEGELSKARNVLFAPYAEGEEAIRVEKWLKKKGDSFVKGEPLVEYTVGRSREVRVLSAPFDGTLGEVFVESWDEAEVGQTLATVVPAVK